MNHPFWGKPRFEGPVVLLHTELCIFFLKFKPPFPIGSNAKAAYLLVYPS